MLALSSLDHRGQKLNPCPLRQGHNLIHHLIHALLFNLLAAFRAMRDSYSCKQQTEIVVYLCHGSHRGTRVAVCGLLVDGNGRGQALNAFHVGFLHLP